MLQTFILILRAKNPIAGAESIDEVIKDFISIKKQSRVAGRFMAQ